MLSLDEIKEIQLRELEYIDTVCRENGLEYSIAYGTLIGAVRHKGFIPWDDDLDFGLIREEYERLYQYCLMNQDDNGIIEFAYSGKVEKLKFWISLCEKMLLIQ